MYEILNEWKKYNIQKHENKVSAILKQKLFKVAFIFKLHPLGVSDLFSIEGHFLFIRILKLTVSVVR